jgi:hypothetical protein
MNTPIVDLLLQLGANDYSSNFNKMVIKRTAILIRNRGDFLSSISSMVVFIFNDPILVSNLFLF